MHRDIHLHGAIQPLSPVTLSKPHATSAQPHVHFSRSTTVWFPEIEITLNVSYHSNLLHELDLLSCSVFPSTFLPPAEPEEDTRFHFLIHTVHVEAYAFSEVYIIRI